MPPLTWPILEVIGLIWSASTLECLDSAGHVFIVNPIIYAECSIGYDTLEEMEALVGRLDFAVKPLPHEALFLAGKAFLQYRRNKGQKGNVLPDFSLEPMPPWKNTRSSRGTKAGFPLISPALNLSFLTTSTLSLMSCT